MFGKFKITSFTPKLVKFNRKTDKTKSNGQMKEDHVWFCESRSKSQHGAEYKNAIEIA